MKNHFFLPMIPLRVGILGLNMSLMKLLVDNLFGSWPQFVSLSWM